MAMCDGTSVMCPDGILRTTPQNVSAGNPTATGGPAAVLGGASTFMRSDAAPAIQTAAQNRYGLVYETAISPMQFGCVGDGVTDDTMCMQNSINLAAGRGVPLRFDLGHLYSVGPLQMASPALLEGPLRYGEWTVNQANFSSGPQRCPWGLVARNPGATLIAALAVTGTIRGLCIDMTGNQAVQATAGAAIDVTPPAGNYSSGWHIEQNTILQPYDGIRLGYGAGVTTQCCGQSTTADGDLVAWNTIVDPANDAISIGKGTAATVGGPGTVGISVWDNAIVCGKFGTSRGHAGVALYEGAIWYDGSQNGPEGCNIGTLVAPGMVGAAQQGAQLSADGVFGDQSVTHDLLIQPQGGLIWSLSVGGKQPWAAATGNVNSVLVDCTATGSSCQNFSFTNASFHSGTGSTVAVVDIEAGAGGPYNLAIVGSNICQLGTPGAGSIGLKLNQGTANPGAVGRWVVSGNLIGTGCPGNANAIGIQLITNPNADGPNPGATTIIGNDISAVTTPISYSPNPSDNVIIDSNLGVDNNTITITAAATITLPAPYKMFEIVGTTTINTINGMWQGRRARLASTGTGMNMTPGGNICLPPDTSVQTVDLQWFGGGTCWTHVP